MSRSSSRNEQSGNAGQSDQAEQSGVSIDSLRASGLSLGPRTLERPADAGSTLVGGLDSLTPARVDGAGIVQLDGCSWSFDWWIGGDDRWYFPAREATVRQRRMGAGPVLETAVRIPSGDAIVRTYAVVGSGGADGDRNVARDAVVVEFENDSPVPVALALAIRPYGLDGAIQPLQVELDGDLVQINDRPILRLPRAPNQFGTDADDILEVLEAGADLGHTAAHRSAVLLYPLAHRTTLRFVLADGGATDPATVPDATTVANGWDTVVAGGGRVVLPDNGLNQQVDAARGRLLGAANTLPRRIAALEPGSGRILEGLALSGAVGDVLGSLGAFAGTWPTTLPGTALDGAAIVSGIGRAARLADDVPMAEELLEPAAQLTSLVEKAAKKERDGAAGAEALAGLARLLIAAGQVEAGVALFEESADRLADVGLDRADIAADLPSLSALAETASSANRWGDDNAFTAARFWIAARQLLVDDRPGALELLPQFPSAWRGGNVEVHGLATSHGLVSFGIRWHGYRPALLWDLDDDEDRQEGSVAIRCPGLDPDWVTTERRGEALLAGSVEGLSDVPSEGESFQ